MTSLEVILENLRTKTSEQLTFEAPSVRIGRHPDNELQLDFPFVSQWHGVIHRSAEACTYEDLGSTNGSYVNGKPAFPGEPHPLGDGGEIRIGAIRLRPRLVVTATRPPMAPEAEGDSRSSRNPQSANAGGPALLPSKPPIAPCPLPLLATPFPPPAPTEPHFESGAAPFPPPSQPSMVPPPLLPPELISAARGGRFPAPSPAPQALPIKLEPTSPLRHESSWANESESEPLLPALQRALGGYAKPGGPLSAAEAMRVVDLLSPALQVLELATARLLEAAPDAAEELVRLLPDRPGSSGRLAAGYILEFLLEVEAPPGERAARLEELLRAAR